MIPSSPTECPSAAALDRPLTIAGWRAAWLQGADVRTTLRAHLQHWAAQPAAPAWIMRCSTAALAPRIDALAALAAAAPDRATLLQRLPLFGVPFAVKDNIDAAGWPTTAACPAFAHEAQHDASVVQWLRDAGALLVGKTNLDQFATGLVGTRSPYGAPASTLAPGHVSGGSSSGSAVVVSRGEVAFALGTDTAGSGRIPAAFNNIVGLKPTPGRISTHGVLPACRTIDCVSIFALTVDDAAAVLAVLEGADPLDDYSRFEPGPATLPAALRLGVPRRVQIDAAQGHAPAWAAALAQAQALGAQIVEIDFEPLHAVARALYDGPWLAERLLTVQPLLQPHPHPQSHPQSHQQSQSHSQPQRQHTPDALEPTVAAVIAGATRFSAADTFAAQYTLQRQRRQLIALWQQVDALMVPTAPRHPSFADVAADPIGANAVLGTYTNFVNLLGWCALALPAGFGSAGLPFGITLISQANHDAALLPWARRWQAATALPLGAGDRRLQDLTPPCELHAPPLPRA
ncbi:MAG: allophanate hydrolase, partial [Rubrivivax sp.]|nr:allophanate hydrolase [Rubrivivax sp.]